MAKKTRIKKTFSIHHRKQNSNGVVLHAHVVGELELQSIIESDNIGGVGCGKLALENTKGENFIVRLVRYKNGVVTKMLYEIGVVVFFYEFLEHELN